MSDLVDLLDKSNRAGIIRRIEEEGFSRDQKISVTSLRQTKKELYNYLLSLAKKSGDTSITRVLDFLGFRSLHTYNIESKFQEEFKKEFPLERIQRAVNGEEKLPTIWKVRSILGYARNYEARRHYNEHNKFPSIRKVIDSIYPQYPHLAYLFSGNIRLEDFSIDEVRKFLRERYFNGDDISYTGLKQEDPAILSWLRAHSKRKKSGLIEEDTKRSRKVTKTIGRLAGIKIANFSIRGSKKTKRLADINENFVILNLLATHRIDLNGNYQNKAFRDIFPTPIVEVYPKNGKRSRTKELKVSFRPHQQNDGAMYVDIVVDSPRDLAVVEVKNLRSVNNDILKSLEERLCDSERDFYWELGDRKISKKILIPFSRDFVYKKIAEYFSSRDLSLISTKDFRESLELTLEKLEQNGFIRNCVYSNSELLKMFDIIIESPHILVRDSHRQQFNFLEKTLRELLKRIERGDTVEKAPIEVYSQKGQILQNDVGLFQEFCFSLNDLPDLHMVRYIKERVKNVPDNTLFVDVESTGFVGSQIFLIGTAHVQDGDIKTRLYFARNPIEEAAMLRHFSKQAENYREIVTYNGLSFDYPAIKYRLVAHMMQEKFSDGSHTDIYQILNKSRIRQNHRVTSLKLSNLSKMFGDERKDIKSNEIPLMYNTWLTYGNPEVISDILRHNVLDLVTLTAAYLSPDLVRKNNYV